MPVPIVGNKITSIINQIGDWQTQNAMSKLFGRFGFSGNMDNNLIIADGTSVPASGSVGYAPGCKFYLTNATFGKSMEWTNFGTAASSAFYPTGPVIGYGINLAGGPVTSAGGDTAETITLQGLITDTDIAFVGHEVSNDNDQIVAAISNEGAINITGSADPSTAHGYVYAALRNYCTPQWDIFAAGTATTAGGAAAEAITVSGVLATDIAFACYSATDDTDVISDVVCSANTVTVTCSADPSTTHGLHYVVLRPRGTFSPSHYIAYAGTHTTVGGAAAEAITVTGALATDIPMINYNTTDDTDSILKAVVTANTLTVTCSADPSTAHAFSYALLRAY